MRKTPRTQRFVEAVGAKVREARKALAVSQGVVGVRLGGWDAPIVSRVESGKKDLRLSELYEVARVLRVEPRVLVDVEPRVHGRKG